MEIHKALSGWDGRREWAEPSWSFRFGAPQVDRLERCLARARQVIPAGSVVAFVSPDEPAGLGVAFYRWRWAAYLMPEHNLVQPGHPAAGKAEYLIAYDIQAGEPGLELIRRLPGGRLFRVRRP
jgi:hypothetical protein